jgi:hypothetical protein
MNTTISISLIFAILLFSFGTLSYKQFPQIAYGAAVDCIRLMIENETITSRSDCDNLNISTATDPCFNVTSWIDLTRIPLNETSQSLQNGNITGAMSNLNITETMLEELKDNRSNITFSNITLPLLPLDHDCNVAEEVEQIMTPLHETSQSLQNGNITGAMSNLNMTNSMIEELKFILEQRMGLYATNATAPFS